MSGGNMAPLDRAADLVGAEDSFELIWEDEAMDVPRYYGTNWWRLSDGRVVAVDKKGHAAKGMSYDIRFAESEVREA